VSTLVLKLAVAPAFVIATSLTTRRFGARVGGVIGGLPMIAGPILLVLAIEQGRAFAADAAVATLLAVVSLGAFVIGYVAVARRLPWWVAIFAGWGTFAVAILILDRVHVGAVVALVCAAAGLAATLLLLPRAAREVEPHPPHAAWDLPLRALCTIVPIVAVTASAHALGPHASGLLASFPIVTPVLAAFTQAQRGWREAAALLRGFTAGFFAYALFCFIVATVLPHWSIAATFALAAVATLILQAVVFASAAKMARPTEGA
jgi:hypothetical protein